MTTGSTGDMGAATRIRHWRAPEERSSRLAFPVARALQPGASTRDGQPFHSTVRKPSDAITSRSLLGNEEHEVHHVLGLAAEALAQAAVLRGNTSGARILLAVALHQAVPIAMSGIVAKPNSSSAEQAGDGNILAVHQLAV